MEYKVTQIGKSGIYLVEGDITQIPANAIMTAVNSGGLWFGGIDGAIQRVAGDFYHSELSKKMPLQDLQTVVVKGNRGKHYGKFDDVVFVVDDLQSPVNNVVYEGLKASNQEGHQEILFPAIRMGVMSGVVEKTPKETAEKIRRGIYDFANNYGDKTSLEKITLVIYKNPQSLEALEESLKQLPTD